MGIYKQTYNALTGDFDRVLNEKGASILNTGFVGATGIATNYAEAWSRIGRIRLTSEQDQKGCFVGKFEVISQATNPYSYRSHYLQAATIYLKISWAWPEFASHVEFFIKDSISLPADCFRLVEVQRGENLLPHIAIYDLYIRTSYQFDRFFYFYKTNSNEISPSGSFTAFSADEVIPTAQLEALINYQYTKVSWTPEYQNTTVFTDQTEVTIIHTLAKYPSVTIVGTDGKQILADVQYISLSEIVVNFSEATSGTIYLN